MACRRAAVLLSWLAACSFSGSPGTAPPDGGDVDGFTHACAIALDDSLHGWGNNSVGELAIDPANSEVPVPTRVGTQSWRSIAVGYSTTCGIQLDNTLWCWGFNGNGLVGIGGAEPAYGVPQQVD